MMFHHHHHHHHHQEQHQGKTIHTFAKMPIIPERHLFLQGANGPGDSGLVLSTDAKPRLKWTHELHERFIEAVCQLGGAEKATPKTVMKVMGIPGLTLYHLKSHLQKYRLSKNLHGQPNSGTTNKIGGIGAVAVTENRVADANGTQTSFIAESQTNSAVGNSRSLEISEALQMQIEVQRRLHEQLEVQRHLQLRIEAQGKYLQSVLEKAQETLGRQNLGAVGLEAVKVQLSELVSKVSTECLTGAFPELQRLCPQSLQPPDCSFESCLTSCEGFLKDSEIHNGCLALRASNGGGVHLEAKERGEGQGGPKWSELQREKGFLCSIEKESERSTRRFSEGIAGDLSMSIGMYLQEEETKEGRGRRRGDRLPKREDSTKHRGCEEYRSMAFYGASSLDLNAGEEDENDGCSDNRQLDLNGFSWD